MHQENYSLTWHAYSDHLKNMMKEMMMNDDLADVTLVTEDKKQIKANISVLSACSPVFKDILKKENNTSSFIYLRGIHSAEMESIIQFIYLGQATFNEERINELLAVGRSLEIKDLCYAVTETDDIAQDDETSPCVLDASTEEVGEITNQKRKQNQELSVKDEYECEQCDRKYDRKSHLNRHRRTVHEGAKFSCDQCDYQFPQKSSLTTHIQSKHLGVKYPCNQCDLQFSQKVGLIRHIESKHEGVKYTCDHCNYQFSLPNNLLVHIKKRCSVLHPKLKYHRSRS